jgi:Alpha/beta hydrolase domain
MYSSQNVSGAAGRLGGRPRLLVGLWVTVLASPALAAVPNPTVTGPIRVNATPGDPSHDYPQLSTQADLAGHGYVEEEFFFEGTANEYDVVTAPLVNATIRSVGNPYKTRMIVRRPISSRKFNGVVLVEWLNVTSGYNLDALWLLQQDHLMREGYAYVGVSVQRVGVQGAPANPAQPASLTSWSPTRYGTLDVTSGGKFVLANNGGVNAADALSFDIMAQAGQALKNPVGVDPLGGLRRVRFERFHGHRTVIASGVSQSEAFLVSYYNSVHGANPVYDGFFLYLGISGGAYGTFRLPIRTDLPTKVFKVNTENDVLLLGEYLIRQSDSMTLRTWEVAGTSHVGFDPRMRRTALLIRDNLPIANVNVCGAPALSRIPTFHVLNAALEHLVRWVRFHEPPPTAPRIELASPSPIPVPPPPPAPFARGVAMAVRDADGNALGGIQLAQHAVPTATNTGVNTGPGFCFLFGSHVPFTAERLTELYPNHATYVFNTVRATFENLREHFILRDEAVQNIRDAARSDIGN